MLFCSQTGKSLNRAWTDSRTDSKTDSQKNFRESKEEFSLLIATTFGKDPNQIFWIASI